MRSHALAAWLSGLCLLCAGGLLHAAPATASHSDALVADNNLDLQQVITAALQRHPQQGYYQAMAQEAEALTRRGDALLAAPPAVTVDYLSDRPTSQRGAVEMQAGLALPLWRPGERQTARALARDAGTAAVTGSQAWRLAVAGEVREALWDIRLAEARYELARATREQADRLVAGVRKRVELGDLAQADLLLAENYQLEQRGREIEAEAEVMHTRKAYIALTGLERYPAEFAEIRSSQQTIDATHHPLLAAASAEVARARQAARATRQSAAGHPTLSLGTRRDRGSSLESYNNSIGIGISLPFGGQAHTAAAAASAQREVAALQAARDTRYRELQQQFHAVQHQLEVLAENQTLARQRAELASRQLGMAELAFTHNELDLIDLLKIQTSAQTAQQAVREIAITQQRAIARYNQIVGVMP